LKIVLLLQKADQKTEEGKMGKYLVKIEFTDDSGTHKVGDTVELVNTRAAKLKSLGKIGSEIVAKATETNVVQVDLSGSEELLEALEKATTALETKEEEIKTLKTDHLNETETLNSTHLKDVEDLKAAHLTQVENLKSYHSEEIEDLEKAHLEDLTAAETNIQNISTALIGAKTIADYKEVSDSLIEAIKNAKEESDSESEDN